MADTKQVLKYVIQAVLPVRYYYTKNRRLLQPPPVKVSGQIAVIETSNEITAVPQLLDILDVSGCIVTADAMSCQKEIVKKISAKQAEYMIP